MNWSKKVLLCISVLCLAFASMAAEPEEAVSGFRMPVKETPSGSGFDFLEPGFIKGVDAYGCSGGPVYHPGRDINITINGQGGDVEKNVIDVLAVADGIVVDGGPNDWGAIAVKHRYQGKTYYSVYGHMDDSRLTSVVRVGNSVKKGQVLGKIGDKGTDGAHLHFEIRKDTHPNPSNAGFFCSGLGGASRETVASWYENPENFVNSHPAYRIETTSHGSLVWYPRTSVCGNAARIYKDGKEVTKEACSFVKSVCEELLETRAVESYWASAWWRFLDSVGISYLSQQICETRNVNSAIKVTDAGEAVVIEGPGARSWDGAGGGSQRWVVAVPVPAPRPDFVVKDVRLHTPWGPESYKYGLMESINTKAQSGNTGEGSCLAGESSTIIGHFYLSNGYKEDAHGDWRKVDSTETQCDNLKPGDTNTETKNTVISDWITTPGIYNIVYCIDHPKTEQNNGGDHAEKHESNNCSTEAVFEVTGNSYENTTNIDLVASQLQFRGTPPVYAADSIRLGAWITNAGTQGLYTDIRSSYGLSCNGSPQIQLADDGTEAGLLGPGMNAWEEILSPATLPNVSGSCVATFCADHAYMVNEVNKANNCTSLNFSLAVRPQKPILSITKFQDEESCCTTNTGSRIKPNIWVKNSGPVAPATNVQVLYQVSSPVATGNQWVYIGYGIIEPRELPPGKTDEDYMEGSGFTVPKDNAWKLQWHQVRACIKPDGSAPTGDTAQGDICATYQRYSKK